MLFTAHSEKYFGQFLTLFPGGGRKAQDEPAGRMAKLPTSTAMAQRAARAPNCIEQPHLGPSQTQPLLIGLGHHLSSGLQLLSFLGYGVGVLASSSVSFLARPWIHHVSLSSVLLLARPEPPPYCAWGWQWTCFPACSLDAVHPGE